MATASCAENYPLPRQVCRAQLPDFLIISPPKTGSTWLAATLGLHPEVFIPDFKEMHFFNHYLLDKGWVWYADQFRQGRGLTKGEGTPGYCALPPNTIRYLHKVLPDLKLIYLMREPVARAWSTAKHTFRHQQSTFENHAGPVERVSEARWQESFLDVTALRSAHYQAHLQNWLAVYPRQQVFIDFYESIGSAPEDLLSRLFAFLGVKRLTDFSAFSLAQRRNEGLARGLPRDLRAWLQARFATPARVLANYLQGEFGISLPPEWQPLLQTAGEDDQRTGAACLFNGVFDTLPAGPVPPPEWISFTRLEKVRLRLVRSVRVCHEDFYGYLIAFHKGEYTAISRDLGPVGIDSLTAQRRASLEQCGLLFRSPVLEGAKAAVTARQLARLRRGRR